MLYEMAYGVAPFFANDIRQTYVRIMNHEVRYPSCLFRIESDMSCLERTAV